MKVRFSFQIRQAMQVAFAVAEEVENNTSKSYPFGQRREHESRPALLSIRGVVPTFHFEGSLVVKVHMVDLDKFTESWRTPHFANWVVTHVEVRYCNTSETWEANKLLQLKQVRPWHHPHVQDRQEIKGIIGIFIDSAAGEGYTETDPEYNQSGHYTMIDSVEYRRLIEGDLERAQAEAEKKLADILRVDAVAVFYNAPAGEAYYEDSPSGNYKGSGHHPFSYVTEYPYDPAVEEDRERAINEAATHVQKLLAGNDK